MADMYKNLDWIVFNGQLLIGSLSDTEEEGCVCINQQSMQSPAIYAYITLSQQFIAVHGALIIANKAI